MPEQSGPGGARSVASLLAPILGWDKSVEAVAGAMRRLNLKETELTAADRRAILDDLALESGIVGVTARYVVSRTGSGSRSDLASIPPPSSRPPISEGSAAAVLAATVGVHEVIIPLASLLGDDKAVGVVTAAIKRLGLPRERLDREQVTRLMDELCRQEGHVGTTARFVRPRVLAKVGG